MLDPLDTGEAGSAQRTSCECVLRLRLRRMCFARGCFAGPQQIGTLGAELKVSTGLIADRPTGTVPWPRSQLSLRRVAEGHGDPVPGVDRDHGGDEGCLVVVGGPRRRGGRGGRRLACVLVSRQCGHLVVPILVPGPSMQPRMVRTTWLNGEVARGYQETGEGYRAPPPGSGRSCAVQQCGEVSCFGSPTPVAAMVLPSPGRSSTGRVVWRHHSSFRLTFTSEST